MLISKAHRNAVLQLNFLLASKNVKDDAIELGDVLSKMDTDAAFSGGFWVWDTKTGIEYHSTKFRKALGFKDESDFPNVATSWQDQIFVEDLEEAIEAYKAHLDDPINEYNLVVRYRTKNGEVIRLICSGTIVNRGEDNTLMLGTHILL